LVAHLHFLADTQSPTKNAKELPSQRTATTSKIAGGLIDEKKNERLTWGLALLGQDVVILISSNMAAVVRA
jgi:hypothetical protein